MEFGDAYRRGNGCRRSITWEIGLRVVGMLMTSLADGDEFGYELGAPRVRGAAKACASKSAVNFVLA